MKRSFVFSFCFGLALLLTTHYSLLTTQVVSAFVGPTQAPGSGGGLFTVDANKNIGFGAASGTPTSGFDTSSTYSGSTSWGYLFTVASTSNPGLALKVTSGSSTTYVWTVRPFGNLQLFREGGGTPAKSIMEVTPYGDISISAFSGNPSGGQNRLTVGGNFRTVVDGSFLGTITAAGGFSGSGASLTGVLASNVGADAFQSANYAFPASLAVGTSTRLNLPATLSVYGDLAFPNTLSTISATTTNAGLVIQGNKNAGDTGADVIINSAVTRTTGNLLSIKNNSSEKIYVRRDGFVYAQNLQLYGGGTQGILLQGSHSIGDNTNELDIIAQGKILLVHTADVASGDGIALGRHGGGDELTGSSGNQAAVNVFDVINQTGTAGYTGLRVNINELAVGTGQKYLLDLQSSSTSKVVVTSAGNLGIGTTTPSYKLEVLGDLRVSATTTLSGDFSFGGAALTNLNMNGNNVSAVNKLTVTTIDPLYEINGKKYATYAASIAGGVKEEYVGKANLRLTTYNLQPNSYEYILDFNAVKEGSNLWLWRKAVDFSSENVEVFATPIKIPVPIAYEIEGNKIIFRSDKEAEFSYRLIGKRFDWKKHPTSVESNETPSFIIK